MADTRVAVVAPSAMQKVESISAATSTVNDAVAPLDFSFLQLTCVEDAEREEPRVPMIGRASVPTGSGGKSSGRCLRLNNNQLSDVKTIMGLVDKMFVNPMMIGWIDLSFNALTLIDEALLEFGNLEILNLHGNNITNLQEIDKLSGLTKLRKLTLHGNRVEREKGYRFYVLSSMPWLRNLDFSAVTKCDARTAENWRRMNNPHKKKKRIEAED